MSKKPVVLCILDGWGLTKNNEESAIYKANPTFFNSLWSEYPHCELEASGLFVGLPEGQMGNSEVGHTNIGAGRVIYQELPKINKIIQENRLKDNETLKNCIAETKKSGGAIHLMGLMSDGGVHSHMNHIIEIAKIIAKENINVFVHCFLDGRDTQKKSADRYVAKFIEETKQFNNIKVATISGRYYSMDRDNRWDRIEKSYNALTSAVADSYFDSPVEAIEKSYSVDLTDEFVIPAVANGYKGMNDGDSFIFCNFRADRARQMSRALGDKNFDAFERKKVINFMTRVQLTEYSVEHNKFMTTMFPPEDIQQTLGQVVAENNMNQLRIAETEKYAHVTFFFNGGREQEYKNEDRILVKSPAVATYDLQPEMSAKEVNEKLISAINSGKYDMLVVNFANPDMVGHTGKMDATVKAIQTLDVELKKLVKTVLDNDGTIFITADHGNAEKMLDSKTGEVCTTHTTNRVPFIYISNGSKSAQLNNGSLCDIAPTILKILNIKQPELMTGKCLIR